MAVSELPLLLAPRGNAPPADPLGRVYTPLVLAQSICASIDEVGLHPVTVVEPSVGPGAVVRAVRERWPRATITGCDVDPAAEGLALVDYSVRADWTAPIAWGRFDLAIGNPPFVSRAPDGAWVTTPAQAAAHITCALERAEHLVYIQPLPYLAAEWFNRLPVPGQLWPLLPRPWSRVREIGVFCWGPLFGQGPTVVRPLHWKR